MPTTLYTKSGSTDDFAFFSTKSVYRNYVQSTCSDYFEGNFGAPQNKDVDFSFEVEKKSSDTLYVSLKMNGIKREYTKKFWNKDMMPKKIDTFALTEPNQRGYRYLKIWDKEKGKGNDGNVSWKSIINDGMKKLSVKDMDKYKKKASEKKKKERTDKYEKKLGELKKKEN